MRKTKGETQCMQGNSEICTESLVSEGLRVLHVEGATQASFKLSLRVMIQDIMTV